jgi:hypothetical protein
VFIWPNNWHIHCQQFKFLDVILHWEV